MSALGNPDRPPPPPSPPPPRSPLSGAAAERGPASGAVAHDKLNKRELAKKVAKGVAVMPFKGTVFLITRTGKLVFKYPAQGIYRGTRGALRKMKRKKRRKKRMSFGPTTSFSEVGETVAIEGPLYRWVNYVRGWQRRWFVLSAPGLLMYYGNQKKKSCLGTIPLSESVVTISRRSPLRFVLDTESYGVFYLRAACAEQRSQWIRGIQRSCAMHWQLISREDRHHEGRPTSSGMATASSAVADERTHGNNGNNGGSEVADPPAPAVLDDGDLSDERLALLQRQQRPQQPVAAPAEGGEDVEKANTSSTSTAPVRCQPVGVASVAAAEIQTGDAGAVDAVVSTGTAMVKMMEGVMGQAKSSMSQSIQILSTTLPALVLAPADGEHDDLPGAGSSDDSESEWSGDEFWDVESKETASDGLQQRLALPHPQSAAP